MRSANSPVTQPSQPASLGTFLGFDQVLLEIDDGELESSESSEPDPRRVYLIVLSVGARVVPGPPSSDIPGLLLTSR